MEPISDSNRPDPLEESASPLKYLLYGLIAALLLPLLAFYFNIGDALIHPLAMTFGRPTTAIISMKRISTGRHAAGKYVQVNYQYSPDYAPRPDIKVNAAAYDAIKKDTNVAIHFIPGCSSCVALDEDYGSARQQGLEGLAIAIFVFGLTYIQNRFRETTTRT